MNKTSLKNVGIGIVIGATLFGCGSAIADNVYNIDTNPYPVIVNGVTKSIEGYNINDSSYFKLRDIGEQVGFKVDFDDNNNTILITTEEGSNVQSENINTTAVASPTYEVFNGTEYIWVEDAFYYLDTVPENSKFVWRLVYPIREYPEISSCTLCHVDYDTNKTIAEYNIETANIDNKQYISREVFERDVLGRIRQ